MNENKNNVKTILQWAAGIVVLLVIYITSTTMSWAPDTKTHRSSNYNGIDYTIRIYYFPARKEAAIAMAEYFSRDKYRIETIPALEIPSLQDKRYGTSYLYFNNADITQALQIKKHLEQIVGFPINGYRRNEPVVDPSMMFVLTDKRVDS